MANATKKITLATALDIPFDKLSLSKPNVRRIKAGISVEELTQSIAWRGLIQSLHASPLLDAAGALTGHYKAADGSARLTFKIKGIGPVKAAGAARTTKCRAACCVAIRQSPLQQAAE